MATALTDPTTGASAIVNTGNTGRANVLMLRAVSLSVVNGATNACTFTLQGSNDGTNWSTIAYGQGSSGVYTQAAFTAAAGTAYTLYIPPDDFTAFIRANVSAANANGCTIRVAGRPNV